MQTVESDFLAGYEKLNENDFTIGSCSYTEYPRKESNNKGELMYYPLFAQ